MIVKKTFTIFFILISVIGFSVADKERNKDIKKAELYYSKGIAFGRTGKLDSALIYTQYAIDIYEAIEIKEETSLANAYQSLGIINRLLGKYNKAINYYNKAEKIYLKNNDTLLFAYIYFNKANIFRIQQDHNKAENYLFRSLQIFSKDSLAYKDQIALILNNIGLNYLNKGSYEDAISYLSKSLILKKDNKNSHTTLSNLAFCHEKMGNFSKAEQYHIQAIETITRYYHEDNIWLARKQLYYAKFLSNQKRNESEIKQYYNKSLNIYKDNFGEKHPNLSACYNGIGEFYLSNNKTDSALYYFQQSLIALSPEFNNANIASNPGIEKVSSKTHLLSSLKNKANALSKIALTEDNNEYLKLSLLTYDIAIKTIYKIRAGYLSEESKLYLAENAADIFSNALQTSYALYSKTNKQEYLNKAFYYSESVKSAILNESIQNTKALNIGGIPDSLITLEKQLEKSIWTYEELIYEENKKKEPNKNKLEYWNKYLFEQKQEFAKLSEYLENNFKKYYNLKYSNSGISIGEIQNKLSKNDVVLEYYLTNDKLYTFFIGKNESQLLKQNLSELFGLHLNYILKGLSNNDFSEHGYDEFNQYQKSSHFLYNRLLRPFEDKIRNKNLIIIPDGKLAYLPFEVLTTENKNFSRIRYKDLSYFVYENSISYSYSAGFLFENGHNNRSADKKLGAFAPSYNNIEILAETTFTVRQQYREKLSPLKGIKEEVQNIWELIGGDKYLDNNASEKTFKEVASSYDILHLAMHTIMDDQSPMYSKMAFTQSTDSIEDGFLNTYELYNMKLNSRMAVLSSCNSGSGKLQRGEGVMSLARGFIYSGCPSLIMTLWPVEDKSGVNLMTNFYEYLVKGKTKAVSLQNSKIDFINNADQLHAHPYFWSGYVVIGNNEPLFTPYKKYALWLIIFILTAGSLIFIIKYRKKKKESRKIKKFVFTDIAFN